MDSHTPGILDIIFREPCSVHCYYGSASVPKWPHKQSQSIWFLKISWGSIPQPLAWLHITHPHNPPCKNPGYGPGAHCQIIYFTYTLMIQWLVVIKGDYLAPNWYRRLFTVNDPKDAISVVHANKMLVINCKNYLPMSGLLQFQVSLNWTRWVLLREFTNIPPPHSSISLQRASTDACLW